MIVQHKIMCEKSKILNKNELTFRNKYLLIFIVVLRIFEEIKFACSD